MRRDLRQFSARALERFQAGPVREGVRFTAAKDGGPAEILMHDIIGIFSDAVTAKGVIAALADADGGPVRVRLNSPGGDAFEGVAIYNHLKAYTGQVDVVVDGLAASAASIIAMAGDTLTMQDGTMLMIHNASTIEAGDRRAFAATAETLGKIDGLIAGIYAKASGKPAEGWSAAMDAETYYTGPEAVDAGLATCVADPPARPTAQAETPVVAVQSDPPAVESDLARARARRLRLAESF